MPKLHNTPIHSSGQHGRSWRLALEAALAAGLFGAVHNQLSLQLSAEYFSQFKCLVFNLPCGSLLPLWAAAAWVGVLSSCWLGAIMGLALGYGLRRSALGRLRRLLALCLLVNCLGTLAVWLWAPHTLAVIPAEQWQYVWPGVASPRAFLQAAWMHDASYQLATTSFLLTLILGWLYQWRRPG